MVSGETPETPLIRYHSLANSLAHLSQKYIPHQRDETERKRVGENRHEPLCRVHRYVQVLLRHVFGQNREKLFDQLCPDIKILLRQRHSDLVEISNPTRITPHHTHKLPKRTFFLHRAKRGAGSIFNGAGGRRASKTNVNLVARTLVFLLARSLRSLTSM